jgi:hypothetical protein
MTIRFPVAGRNAALNAYLDRADAGSGPAVIEVRSGAQPETADTAEPGTLLVTFTCADPAWSAASGGVKDLDADPDLVANAVAAGTAGWARMKDSDGTTVVDGSVGTSGTDFIINSTAITNGQEMKLTLGSITDPA